MASPSNPSSLPIQQLVSNKITILDVFFPGLTSLSTAVLPLLSGDLSIYARLMFACGTLVFIRKYVYEYLWCFLETHFMSKFEVPYTDEAHDMLISWVNSQPFAQSARSALASIEKTSGRSIRPELNTGDSSNKKLLRYSPWNGHFYFWYKCHLLALRRVEKDGQWGISQEKTTISCFGRSPSVLKEFLDECRRHYLGLIQNKTSVFEHQGDRWKRSESRKKRHSSTVILEGKVKDALMNDISDFLNPTTREWYAERCIPYQRGYLFYGPPGTGKSSFSFCIAGQFDLDIYILNISSLNDNKLKTLFAELPRDCIVLLEDVDAASSKRPEDVISILDQNGSDPSPQQPAGARVSLSTLLNVIDGVGSPEGRILIMTTNQIECLDSALIRPGRADLKIEFQLVNEEMVTQLFCFVYDPVRGRDIEDNELGKSGGNVETGNAVEHDRTPQLAKQFAAKIPKLEFSSAEIMSFLLANKQSPREAIDNVSAWIDKMREDRQKLKKADSSGSS